MELAFYVAAAVAILATARVITNTNPVHALLSLIVSLLAVAMIFPDDLFTHKKARWSA